MKNKLIIFDGNSILYRSFFALPPLTLSDGSYTNAVYGFANIIIKSIQEYKPTHMVVAFDVAKNTFRNDIYADYKATRKPMPDELRAQIEPVKKLLTSMKIKILEKEGLEADDIIGTITKRLEGETEIIVITGDRDTLQLISPKTSIYFTKKGLSEVKVMDAEALKEEYGIKPDSIVDLKALQGDTADNIPGVQGIGPKTALELIQKYETLENVYKNLAELKPGVRNKLEASKDNAEMSYKLAKINRDVDIQCELNDLTFDFPFNEDVYDFMIVYKFNSILKRKELFKEFDKESKELQFQTEKIDSDEKLEQMISTINQNGSFSFFVNNDNEFYFASKKEEWVVPAVLDMFSNLTFDKFFEKIKPLFENESIRKFFYDNKFSRHLLSKYNIEVKGKFDDISILSHLVEGMAVKSPEDVLQAPGLSMSSPAMSLIIAYERLLVKLKELNMEDLYNNLELPLSLVLYDMEKTGFKVDINRINELGLIYSKELNKLISEIYSIAGEEFNINSSQQLGKILFVKLGLPHNKKMSTSAEVLQEIVNLHPIVPVILRYRKVSKIYSTYIEGLKPHIDENYLVHTSFKQTLTTTGRLSSVEPNLQNIPIRSEESREVRSIYVASSPNHILIDADYSQIELRLLAHFSGDEFLVNAFNEGLDIHTQTACQVFNVSADNVTNDMRRIAKVVNFGIIYGISDFGLANDLKISPKEAGKFIDSFYENHPKVRAYMDNAVSNAKDQGKVWTILGRSRTMVDIHSTNYIIRTRAERACQNMPLQGSAADIIKLAMLKVDKTLKEGGYKAKLIMQVHDELLVDCPINEKDEVMKIVRECMNTAIELKVPLVSDVTCAYRWSDGH